LSKLEDAHASFSLESDHRDDAIMHDTCSVLADTLNEQADLLFVASNDRGFGQQIAERVQPFYERI
jgi:hypothetical protein